MRPSRSFLLLQGVCSPFFARLGDRLRREGHAVCKVNFNAGDWAYWRPRPAWSFGGEVATLAEFLDERCRRQPFAPTHQILFGDCRPLHRSALAWAERRGIETFVFEEGYLRPHFITLERGGVNARSALPRDPQWYREVGRDLADPCAPQVFPSAFRDRAWHDVLYHGAGALNWALFPRYRTHAEVTAPIEYAGYVRRFARLARISRRERERARQIATEQTPYYFLPLQLNGDAQIREHSAFSDMREVLNVVTESFARRAPPGTRLVIKNHPLDNGLIDYERYIAALARKLDLENRIEYLEEGEIGSLVLGARGVVTVNSTVGLVALELGRPTKALARAIYDLEGLTWQGPLDEFWSEAVPPERELLHCFRRVLIRTTQVNGGFYSRAGIELGVEHSLPVLCSDARPPLATLQ